jgi:hypothetical protein
MTVGTYGRRELFTLWQTGSREGDTGSGQGTPPGMYFLQLDSTSHLSHFPITLSYYASMKGLIH